MKPKTMELVTVPFKMNFAEAQQSMTSLAPLVKEVLAMSMTTPEAYEKVSDFGRRIKTLKDRVEASRKAIKAPILRAGRETDKHFKPLLEACSEARETIDQKLLDYHDFKIEEAEQEEARLRVEAERRKKIIETTNKKKLAGLSREERKEVVADIQEKQRAVDERIEDEIDQVSGEAETVAGISFREDWEIEIVEPGAVPETYMKEPVVPNALVFYLWQRDFNLNVLKGLRNEGVEIPGVKYTKVLKTAMRGL